MDVRNQQKDVIQWRLDFLEDEIRNKRGELIVPPDKILFYGGIILAGAVLLYYLFWQGRATLAWHRQDAEAIELFNDLQFTFVALVLPILLRPYQFFLKEQFYLLERFEQQILARIPSRAYDLNYELPKLVKQADTQWLARIVFIILLTNMFFTSDGRQEMMPSYVLASLLWGSLVVVIVAYVFKARQVYYIWRNVKEFNRLIGL